MNKIDLTSLLERVRNATGSDRELDAEIAQAVEGVEIQWRQANGTMEMYPVQRYPSTAHAAGFGIGPVPEYTASIDAALALVERVLGHAATVHLTIEIGSAQHACSITLFEKHETPFVAEGSPNPALAVLCALTAALTSNQDGNDEAVR